MSIDPVPESLWPDIGAGSSGSYLRLRRLFDPAGRAALVVPMDQGIEGDFPELERGPALVAELVAAGATAFLLRRGLARRATPAFAGRAGLIQRVTTRSRLAGRDDESLLDATAAGALRNGADAAVFTVFVGPVEDHQLEAYGRFADECHALGLPLIGEPFPGGLPGVVPYDGPFEVEDLRTAVRVASEEGADLVKTAWSGSEASFRRVVAYSTVPVLLAGGPRSDDPAAVLGMIKGAMDAGACGTAVGRKIWQWPDPARMLHAVARIVLEGADVDAALAALG
jgi:fructose-bisphosphate aldolase / 2-amino-3,7-dideoxy-D-threo-hept-6-ulosonate synthase